MKKMIVSRKLNAIGFALKENSSKICLVGGLIAGGACIVMSVRQTLKASKRIDQMHDDISEIEEAVGKEYFQEDNDPESENSTTLVYTEEDARSDSIIVHRSFIVDIAKLYAPVAGLGVLSVLLILKSYGIAKARYVATAAALASVEKAFGEYRDRVRERYGDETENDIFHGVKQLEIEEVDENGKETKSTVDCVDPDTESVYTRLIRHTNPIFDPNLDFMANVCNIQQKLANDILISKGFLTLNEVYRLFNLEQTPSGMVFGWIYDDDNEIGDNMVEFDVKRVCILADDGKSVVPAYSISFNADGNIYKRLTAKY